jgi:hypothetical protein
MIKCWQPKNFNYRNWFHWKNSIVEKNVLTSNLTNKTNIAKWTSTWQQIQIGYITLFLTTLRFIWLNNYFWNYTISFFYCCDMFPPCMISVVIIGTKQVIFIIVCIPCYNCIVTSTNFGVIKLIYIFTLTMPSS